MIYSLSFSFSCILVWLYDPRREKTYFTICEQKLCRKVLHPRSLVRYIVYVSSSFIPDFKSFSSFVSACKADLNETTRNYIWTGSNHTALTIIPLYPG